MRILFMGTPDFAVPSLKALHEKHDIIGVFTKVDKPNLRGGKIKFVLGIGDGKYRKVINPKFLEYSKEIAENDEGCLSIPGIYKKVCRPAFVKVEYTNEKGEKVVVSVRLVFLLQVRPTRAKRQD